VNDETNTINAKKSEQFQSALLKAGYTFPAQWTSGNLNIRKPYDEGYFSLDAQGQLYHIKMVNGKPFIRNTKMDAAIEPAFFSMLEVSDKRFYGFLFDKKGNIYILEEAGGKYKTTQLEIDPLNLDTDELMILGNFLYWTVGVQTDSGKHFYALDAESLKKVRYAYMEAPVNKWNIVADRLFPVYLDFKDSHSDFVAPYTHFTAFSAFIINAILAVLVIFIPRRKSNRKKIFDSVFTLIFGIAGAIALWVIPQNHLSLRA
jgi:hypothetical protein